MSAKPDHDKSGHEVFGPDDDRYDAIGASEARHASGFVKVAGKHKSADGLLSRGGYRRVLPDYEDAEWLDLEKPERLAELEEIKSKVLHGRNATIFEQLVLAPLRGERGKTVEELAEQFNKSPDRIYKVKHKAKARVMTFVAREQTAKQTRIDGRLPPIQFHRWGPYSTVYEEALRCGDTCPTCGRVFAWTTISACNGTTTDPLAADLRPECQAAQQRAKDFEAHIAEFREADRIWWETEGRALMIKDSARFVAEAESVKRELGLPPFNKK